MHYLFPQPDAEGIAKMKDLYLNRFDKELTDEQAAEILARIMRVLYVTSDLCSDTLSTPANLKKTKAD